jgi:hypothetical protein
VTVPALCPGLTAVMCVSESTLKYGAFIEPNATDVAPENAVPVIPTAVPPYCGPLVGDAAVRFGAWVA